MPINLYDKIKPKGEFAIADAADIEMPSGKRLDAEMEEAGQLLDENGGKRVRIWFGTQEEFDALETIQEDVYYNIFEDEVGE
ncbi:MAG: hypothetical protein IJ306_08860 [Oscillospiraceae bacterium]|nr:hypothetical protein [Oscillospiraceae bacterium]